MLEFPSAYAGPGIRGALETSENQFWWDRWQNQIWMHSLIDGATRDVGNTGYTTILRPGLILGMVTATKQLTAWAPTATDGSENIFGILGHSINMQIMGADVDRYIAWVLVGGMVKSNRLIVPGQTAFGISNGDYEFLIRSQLSVRMLFSDNISGAGAVSSVRRIIAKTADYTVLTSDNGTLFTNLGAVGAVIFTLPTPAPGLVYEFFVAADQSVTVASVAANGIIGFNNAASDSIAFATSSEKLGGYVKMIGLSTSKWAAIVGLGSETQTPTIAA